jgi:hypothetical protein
VRMGVDQGGEGFWRRRPLASRTHTTQ